MAKKQKTNVMRLLEQAEIEHREYEYNVDDGLIDAKSIARKIGEAEEQVFKTLVTQNEKHEYFVFVIPANSELDFKKAASASGQKSIEMIPMKELFPLTGYVHGGCSPIGMKKQFPTYLDETAVLFDYICFSGGKIGTNVGVNPEQLAAFIPADFADLTRS